MNVVMFGDFSGRNVGHNALLRALVSQLAVLDPTRIIVPTLRPDALRRVVSDRDGVDFLGVAPWHGGLKFRSRRVRQAVDDADLVLLVDNQLHDKGFGNPLRNNLAALVTLTAQASERGVPSAYLHGSLGPLSNPGARALAASLARQLDMVLLRDTAAKDGLAELAPDVSAKVTADAAFAAPDPGGPIASPRSSEMSAVGGGEWIALNLSADATRASLDAWVSAVRGLRARFGRRVLIVVTHPRDRRTAEALLRKLGSDAAELLAPEPETFLDGMSALPAELACAVGDRYHELVMFAASGIPIIGVATGDKVPALFDALGLADLLFDVGDADVGDAPQAGDRLVQLVQAALERRGELAASVTRQRATVEAGVAALQSLLA